MEAKRLGLCQKSLFVVPNHLTEQWAAEFLHLYPNAKLLVARRKDFETANRKKFCARIATGDYDAVIIGHSQFERIPLSFERQERIIQEQIDEIQDAISELKYASGERFTVKQMEKSRKIWNRSWKNCGQQTAKMTLSPSSNWAWTDCLWTNRTRSKTSFCTQKCGMSQV